MRARLINRDDIVKLVRILMREYEVVAPFCSRGSDTVFDVVTEENIDKIQLHVRNPIYPPKRFVLPHVEQMFEFQMSEVGVSAIPTYNEKPRALFGIRSCDIAGIKHLDNFFLGREFVDPYYLRQRRNLFLVNVVCTEIGTDVGEYCFCLCADTGPAARDGFDLQLMDLGDVWMVVAGTERGSRYLDLEFMARGDDSHIKLRREILSRVRHQFFDKQTSWFSAAMRLITRLEVSESTWEKIGRRCLECGGCSFVCPTCSCFTVDDRRVSAGKAIRMRLWDSCALGGFTRMAGGFNPRKAVHDRRNRRFFHKLAYQFVLRDGSIGCVGCGRCAVVCHGAIGMPSVVEIIRRQELGSQD